MKSILLLFVGFNLAIGQKLQFGGYYCWVRCVAKCLEDNTGPTFEQCGNTCNGYKKNNLCSDHSCWQRCKDMTNSNIPETPQSFKAEYDRDRNSTDPGRMVQLQWLSVDDAKLYIVEYIDNDDKFAKWEEGGSGRLNVTTTSLLFRKPNMCPSYSFRVASVSAGGVSSFTEIQTIEKGAPLVFHGGDVPTFLSTVYYRGVPVKMFPAGEITSPDSILVEIGYELPLWPREDLDFSGRSNIGLNTHLFKCDKAEKKFLPAPTVYSSSETEPKITLQFLPNYMERSCQFMILISEFRSKTCGTVSKAFARVQGQMLMLNCQTVKDSPCAAVTTPVPPTTPNCLATNFNFAEIESARTMDNTTTVQVVWDELIRSREQPILYYFANFGEAERYDDNAGAFVGVKMRKNIGLIKTCDEDNNITVCTNQTRELNITGIEYDKLYGVSICAMYDENYDLNRLFTLDKEKQYRVMAYELFIPSKKEVPEHDSSGVLVLAIAIPLVVAVLVAIIVVFVIFRHKKRFTKQQKDIEIARLEMEARERDFEQRYTDMPEREDIWELDRKHLIVYEGQKLGSGAFGAVFKGKLMVKALGHKHASSRLVENVRQVDKAIVAVKRLPEYADPFSKADFLKEIELMKNLGYHENLVNMMASITKSEPYGLVVEYCSEGDLLHFLRERRDYMMTLDKLGVDYGDSASNDDNEDLDNNLIVSLKQLLQFGLQISQGLQYLSQKNYVHRDIAARNVLVNREGDGIDSILRAKVGDFGLCRFVYQGSEAYWGKGGRLPIKWMSPEAVKHYEFTSKSDVWSFGVLLFEIITLGGSPYPGIQPADMESHLEEGNRMDQPDNCDDEVYKIMLDCWHFEPSKRPTFEQIGNKLAKLLEEVVGHDYFLVLDGQRDYYNAPYGDLTHANRTVDKEPVILDNPAFDDEQSEKQMETSFTDDDDNRVNLKARDSGFDSISLDETETPSRTRNFSDSNTSDQALITPIEKPPIGSKFKFFLPKVPEQRAEGVSNPSYPNNDDEFL